MTSNKGTPKDSSPKIRRFSVSSIQVMMRFFVELVSVNESIKAEITELKRKLRLEELEQRIKDLVDQN